MTATAEYDVIIAGSGPAGCAAAITLARAGRHVLIVEKRETPRPGCGETIAPAAKIHVEALLGPLVPRALPDWSASCRGNISIWGSGEPAMQDFFYSPYGPGLCIDRAGFDAALLGNARSLGVDIQIGATITGATRQGGHWDVVVSGVDGATKAKCAYLVDATGRAAALGKLFGVQREREDPLFSFALRFTSPQSTDKDGFTRIESSPHGWWYSNRLPSTDDTKAVRLVVFHADRQSPEAREAAIVEGLLRLLEGTTLIGETLATHGYVPDGQVKGAPAGNAVSEAVVADGLIAVGDAAQAYDPLSSQGLERSLISGTEAGRALCATLAGAAASDAFAPYQAQMRGHWATYLQQHEYFYAMEPRWADHPFWARRTTGISFPMPSPSRNAQ